MANLYVWFPDKTEHREFLLKLLEIEPIRPRNKSKKAREEAENLKEDLSLAIWKFEAGKTKSPWYQLHRTFYYGRVPDSDHSILPWSKEAVFEKGFRSIYTQKSYYFRPGFWLVLKFRETKAAGEKYRWVLKQIPESRMGTSVPVPPSVILKWKLLWVEKALSEVTFLTGLEGKYPGKCLEYLNDIKASEPELFKKGDNVYLWERLAFAFEARGRLQGAE